MWHFRFSGAIVAVLALLGFMEGRTALAAHPISLESSMSLSPEAREMPESFQVAVMGNSAIPMDMPSEPFAKKDPSKKPAADQSKASSKASTPQKKKVKQSAVTPTPAKPPVEVEEEGFLTKTFNKLIGNSDPSKETSPKPELQKMAEKKPEPAKEEGGLLTRTLKSLVGGDEKKEEKKETKNSVNPLKMAPNGSATQQKEVEKPKTAKSETKQTLKDSFEKLIGVGGGTTDDKAESKPASASSLSEATRAAKAKVKPVEKAPEPKKSITAREYIEGEAAQLEKDRGGVQKGKNLLKESFKTLVAE